MSKSAKKDVLQLVEKLHYYLTNDASGNLINRALMVDSLKDQIVRRLKRSRPAVAA
jgi:hypothetical protein